MIPIVARTAMFCLVVLLSSAFASLIGYTAEPTLATVSGTVSSQNGAAVSSAEILLSGPIHATTTTDFNGRFVLTQISNGTYRLQAISKTYGSAVRANIVISGDITVAVTFTQESRFKVIGHVSTSTQAQINVSPVAITSLTSNEITSQG